MMEVDMNDADRIMIDFSFATGYVNAKKQELVITFPFRDDIGIYYPESSMVIYSEGNLKRLRDALIEAYPLDMGDRK